MRDSEKIREILTSEQGRKILDYISPIYDEAYVALWLLQAIGLRLDDIVNWSDDLWKEIIPQTAVWSLPYWESEYGIPTNPNLSITQRRNTLLAAIRTRAPMNPWKIAQIASNASGVPCRVEENTAKNTFRIYLSAISSPDINENLVRTAVTRAKPSHLIFEIKYEQGASSTLYACMVSHTARKVTLRQVN